VRLEPPYDPTDGRDYIRRDTSSVSARMHFADGAALWSLMFRYLLYHLYMHEDT